MKFVGGTFRKVMLCVVCGLVLLVIVIRNHAIIQIKPNTLACFSETKTTLKDMSGGDFEIVYTTCDSLAKDESISVYVSSRSWISRLFYKETLLFRYDPAMSNDPLPSITASSQNRILISIPQVSSIDVQRRNWGIVSIDYQIGKIFNPGPVASQ